MKLSTTLNSAQVTLEFSDETTRTYTLPSIPASAIANIPTKVKAINGGTAENVDAFKATFIANSGASFVSISSAVSTTVVEDVIYSG